MTRKQLSPRLLKVSKNKERRMELDKAMKALIAIKNQPSKVKLVRAAVSDNTVVVTVQRLDKDLRKLKRVGSYVAVYVDQSVKDTERAVRTLQRAPSEKVREFYERLAAQK